jgi:hypothetical protein
MFKKISEITRLSITYKILGFFSLLGGMLAIVGGLIIGFELKGSVFVILGEILIIMAIINWWIAFKLRYP